MHRRSDCTMLMLLCPILILLAGCEADRRIAAVREYMTAREKGELTTARSMLAPDARVWYENPAGDGSPWKIGEGPWAGWDAHFRSTKRLLGGYQRAGDAVFALFDETNGYYRLTERTWSRTLLTWFVNDDGKLRGLLVTGVGTSISRADEFRLWVREHEPAEYAYLYPNDQLDPSADRPARIEALLHRWRASIGLPPLNLR